MNSGGIVEFEWQEVRGKAAGGAAELSSPTQPPQGVLKPNANAANRTRIAMLECRDPVAPSGAHSTVPQPASTTKRGSKTVAPEGRRPNNNLKQKPTHQTFHHHPTSVVNIGAGFSTTPESTPAPAPATRRVGTSPPNAGEDGSQTSRAHHPHNTMDPQTTKATVGAARPSSGSASTSLLKQRANRQPLHAAGGTKQQGTIIKGRRDFGQQQKDGGANPALQWTFQHATAGKGGAGGPLSASMEFVAVPSQGNNMSPRASLFPQPRRKSDVIPKRKGPAPLVGAGAVGTTVFTGEELKHIEVRGETLRDGNDVAKALAEFAEAKKRLVDAQRNVVVLVRDSYRRVVDGVGALRSDQSIVAQFAATVQAFMRSRRSVLQMRRRQAILHLNSLTLRDDLSTVSTGSEATAPPSVKRGSSLFIRPLPVPLDPKRLSSQQDRERQCFTPSGNPMPPLLQSQLETPCPPSVPCPDSCRSMVSVATSRVDTATDDTLADSCTVRQLKQLYFDFYDAEAWSLADMATPMMGPRYDSDMPIPETLSEEFSPSPHYYRTTESSELGESPLRESPPQPQQQLLYDDVIEEQLQGENESFARSPGKPIYREFKPTPLEGFVAMQHQEEDMTVAEELPGGEPCRDEEHQQRRLSHEEEEEGEEHLELDESLP